MNLSKREQLYALITGLVLLVGLAYFYLIEPYFAARTQLIADVKTAQSKYDHELQLLDARPKVAADWKGLLATANVPAGVLKTIPAEASSQAHDALYDAAYYARFDLQSFTSDRPRPEGDFQVIRLSVTGIGSTASLYRFIAALEHSSLPLRIEDMRVTSRHPGVDDLNIALTVSTIIFAPTTTSRPAPQPQPQGDNL
ncbi:MAG: type II secretion system protein M [Phycisphaerales bacterium]|nr:type II secretion system protein M [Phycisphaerales bacterium]